MNLLYKGIVGSQAYGLATPTSDVDYKGVYVSDFRDIGAFVGNRFIKKGKDEIYYELGRFVELLCTANPTVLEMLYLPEQFVIEQSPVFELLRNNRKMFLTKQCRNSFGGYAVAQLKKARGTSKKVNWEYRNVSKKDILDFCYVYPLDFTLDSRTLPFKQWLRNEDMKQENCGLVKLNNFRNGYGVYYDYVQYTDDANDRYLMSGYRGAIKDIESSQLRLSSIPKGREMSAILFFNSDGFSAYSKEYREYKEWLENKNEDRYVSTKKEGEKINAKNLMHCIRLVETAKEIASEGELIVHRPNREFLLGIRRGEYELEELIEKVEEDIEELDDLYINSDLPDKVDVECAKDLVFQIRKEIYL